MTDPRAADVVTELLLAIDVLDWEGVETALDDDVRLDYTSLWGGEPETVPAAEVIARWRALLPGFDATQHLTGPVLVSPTTPPAASDSAREAEAARCRTTVRGYHYVDGEPGGVWMVAGRYDIRARLDGARWRIASITLHTDHEDGDRALTDLATKRARSGTGGRAGGRAGG